MKKKTSIRRALFLSFATRYTTLAFNFATVVIVSRILTPKEIGVFSVAVGITALIQMLRTFGVSEYLVQAHELDEKTVRTAFTVNFLISWSLGLGLYAISGMVGGFYGNSGVADVLKVVSGAFLLNPFGTTVIAQLKRDLEFKTLYKIQVGEVTVRSGLTIGLVFAGFSYMSMAWASLVATVAWLVGCGIWGRPYFARGFSLHRWREVFPFGLKQTFADIVVQLGEQSANVVIGKMLGIEAAGYYSRGYSLVRMYRQKVVGAINAVAFPAFARENRERQQAPELFKRSLVLFTSVSWPFLGVAAIMAAPIIRFFFGTQWAISVPVMQWLCGAAILGTLTYQCAVFLTGVGRVGVVTSIVAKYQLLRVAFAIVASLFSIDMVAASQIIVYAIAAFFYYRVLTRYEALSLRKLGLALWPSLVVACLSCIGPALVAMWLGANLTQHYLIALAIAIPSAILCWILALLLVGHPMLKELQYLKSAWARRLSPSNP